MAGGSVQLATGFSVAHGYSPLLAGIRPQSNGGVYSAESRWLEATRHIRSSRF
ncbi:hypothetical protein SJ05684_c11990 [Sinorhizobium sojae CCBAU 05684]|uniref:Uncharacterized protein n=1 Tax=Sinorhizobium sojae CCBAU 05684 TaxID=716928 RepID=A0A249PA52_9HYPH|nr:hypothetical protein SJ05684_c11990 [Sinorhizobium sojae CCBAU 05684]